MTKKKDISQKAKFIVDFVTGEDSKDKGESKNPHAVALGSLGGRKGGPARAEKLTPEQRSEIAKKGAKARWEKKDS